MAQIGDTIHEDVCCAHGANAGTHAETHTHTPPSETADSQGFALCSAYMEVIDIWLLADTF